MKYNDGDICVGIYEADAKCFVTKIGKVRRCLVGDFPYEIEGDLFYETEVQPATKFDILRYRMKNGE